MEIKTFIVDSFTNEPFKGNPAGVCLLEDSIPSGTMQSIASEINLSETAFLVPIGGVEGQFSIRFFTRTVEIDFCGHATLASAKIGLEKLGLERVEFTNRNGLKLSAEADQEYIKMLFPIYETVEYQGNQELLDAFGIINPINSRFNEDLGMVILEVKDKEALLAVNPDYKKALQSALGVNELVVTSHSQDGEFDFYSRCFCPWIGIDEDPVTGASHSALAKYWGNKLGKRKMEAYQLSDRGGFLKLNLLNDTSLEVRSNAKIMFEGVMRITAP